MISDKQTALIAVNKDGLKLRSVSESLCNDSDVVLTAMQNNKYAIQFASEDLRKDKALTSQVEKNDSYYWNMIDSVTGLRYDIPMLSTIDPNYYQTYVSFMKVKERSPNTF